MDAIFVVGVVVLMALSAWLAAMAARAKARRRTELALVAEQSGCSFSEADPFDCTRIAFDLFRRGDGRGAENVLWRTGVNELPVRAFDFWYYDEHRNDRGQVRRSYTYRTCVVAQVNSAWPDVFIARERVLDKVLNWVGAPDVELESEEFNRTFVVRCGDARFATALVDAQMMEFLLGTKGVVSFTIKGRWLLLETAQVKPTLFPPLMRLADGFIDRIPRVVWELFPSPFFDADGKPLPAGDEPGALPDLDEVVAAGEAPASPFQALYDHLDADGVEYDLDGKPLPARSEDPWGDGEG